MEENPQQKEKATMQDVFAKMQTLGIEGWSSTGKFTPDDHMGHLAVIEALMSARRSAARQLSGGHTGDV
ncbi:hypothetical protein HY213_04010 [Candidatus Peregrinibacteria bacterium]|nr:hypothetical protein [Candidatus Peregrinibacteria bacterium]